MKNYTAFKARMGKKDREAKRETRRVEKAAKRAERHVGHDSTIDPNAGTEPSEQCP
jgi:hypothetical protein